MTRLSAPIFRLKKQARTLSRAESIPLHEALNRIANAEGFKTWSLLSATMTLTPTSAAILSEFEPGDLVLLAARPFQGKTTLGLSLIAGALREGKSCAFFSLYFTQQDTHVRLTKLGVATPENRPNLFIDTSDEISAGHIIRSLATAAPGTLIVVDYLQLLDQRRDTPVLNDQVQMLKDFARARGVIIVLISQIVRQFETTSKALPDLSDVHLPNPIDLTVFSTTCFMGDGTIQIDRAA